MEDATTTAAIAVSVLFAIVGAYCLVRTVVGFSWTDRVSNGIHAVMSVVMLAMPWAWYAAIPAIAQIAFFTAAAFWYVYLALFRPHADAGMDHAHHRSPIVLAYHAMMSVAMVWMAVAMTSTLPAGGSAPGHVHGTDAADTAEDMDAMATMTGGLAWAVPISVAFGILFALAAAGFLVVALRRAYRAASFTRGATVGILDSFASTLMAAGMALAFLGLMI